MDKDELHHEGRGYLLVYQTLAHVLYICMQITVVFSYAYQMSICVSIDQMPDTRYQIPNTSCLTAIAPLKFLWPARISHLAIFLALISLSSCVVWFWSMQIWPNIEREKESLWPDARASIICSQIFAPSWQSHCFSPQRKRLGLRLRMRMRMRHRMRMCIRIQVRVAINLHKPLSN